MTDSTSKTSSVLRLENWPITRLIPSARNARTHSEAQVAEIAASISAFGFSNPILVGENGDIVAGHGRLAAARRLGLSEVPVVVLRGLTEVQRRQLMLADNRIALNAGWDLEMLHLELTDLTVLGAELEGLGFTAEELAKALNPGRVTGLTDEDEIPELAEQAVSAVGDVWLAGPHRIACGDSTDSNAVAALLDGQIPQLMVTRLTACDMIPRGATAPVSIARYGAARSLMTIGLTGERPGNCFPATSPMFGMVPCMPRPSLKALSRKILPSAPRSSGRKNAWSWGVAITIGSMSPAGMRCARRATGLGTASRPRYGLSRAAIRTPKPFTARKSRSSACAGLC
jgi:ParB-like nuclease family protein